MIDLHCHILPGLDDGAQTLEEALEMARVAREDGIEKIVATPHLFRNNFIWRDFGIIEEKRQELSWALKKNNIDVEIFPGAEVHISHNLTKAIKEHKDFLVLNHSSYMFVEFPSEHVFSDVKRLFFELMSEGITPIIAHPERNSVFTQNPGLLYDLVQMGALSQANSGSFSGLYGNTVKEGVYQFLELRLIHFIATDGHNTRSILPKLSEALEKAAEVVGEKESYHLVRENPQAVLNDKEISYFPEPVDPRRKEKSFSIKIPNFFRSKK